MPSGTLMLLSVTAAFVSSSEGCGGRNTSTCRAATCSIRTRPVNSELNDQLTRASVRLSHTPFLSRNSIFATRRSTGMKPLIPSTLIESEDAMAATSAVPGGVCRPANSAAPATTTPPTVHARTRPQRIRRPVRC